MGLAGWDEKEEHSQFTRELSSSLVHPVDDCLPVLSLELTLIPAAVLQAAQCRGFVALSHAKKNRKMISV